ncbi:MAG: hypothetical protein ACFFCS_29100, partial [Candidatus Hodarchaeota archaeon]
HYNIDVDGETICVSKTELEEIATGIPAYDEAIKDATKAWHSNNFIDALEHYNKCLDILNQRDDIPQWYMRKNAIEFRIKKARKKIKQNQTK